jgi:hypothetical protein
MRLQAALPIGDHNPDVMLDTNQNLHCGSALVSNRRIGVHPRTLAWAMLQILRQGVTVRFLKTIRSGSEDRQGTWWSLQCVEIPDALSQSKTLAEAKRIMPEAIAFVAGVPEAEVEVVVAQSFPTQ